MVLEAQAELFPELPASSRRAGGRARRLDHDAYWWYWASKEFRLWLARQEGKFTMEDFQQAARPRLGDHGHPNVWEAFWTRQARRNFIEPVIRHVPAQRSILQCWRKGIRA
jgi:hypothetical protein